MTEPVGMGKREPTGGDAIQLADALDQFFYDLVFTAPEATNDRVRQLGNRIRKTMLELGYPKRRA